VALSDYERRVLAEIEVELGGLAPSKRRGRLGLIAILVCALVPLAGIGALCALFLPAAAGVGVCAAAGALVGAAVMLIYHRIHRL
jgi:hypothetical protein